MADFGNPNTDHPPPTYQQAIDDTPLAENNVEGIEVYIQILQHAADTDQTMVGLT